MKKIILVLLISLFVVSCGLAYRQSLMKDKYPYYPVHIRQAIDQQKVIEGMDYEQVYLAIGLTWCKSRSYYKGKNTEVWVYQRDLFTGKPTLPDNCNKGSIRIYFEDEKVVGWDNL